MSATAFQRLRREIEAKKQAEAKIETKDPGSLKPTRADIIKQLEELKVPYGKKDNVTVLTTLLDEALKVVNGSKENHEVNQGEGNDLKDDKEQEPDKKEPNPDNEKTNEGAE